MSPVDDTSYGDALGRIVEIALQARAEGRSVDAGELARRFDVTREEVDHCLAAVDAIGDNLEDEALPQTGETDVSPNPTLPDDYEVEGEIGRGGMAVVYRARQRSLGRSVAVKVLRSGDAAFGDILKRFQAEARTLAKLRHPHIVAIHEVGEVEGNVFFSMDLIEGSTVAGAIRRGGMTPTRVVKLIRQVTSAIASSHTNGIVHRDLKPANVLVDRSGDAHVVDFGLARDQSAVGDATRTGQLLGTPAYMSPEQARGDRARIGEATDIHALGAILYECLTGRPPFSGDTIGELIQSVIQREPPRVRRLNPKVPPDLEIICMKALMKEPEERYATAEAMLQDLERFEDGRPIRARPPSVGYRVRRFARRHWVPLTAAVTAAVVVALVVGMVLAKRIGGTPETLLATAEQFHAQGRHQAAVDLFEMVRDRTGWKPPAPLPDDDAAETLLAEPLEEPGKPVRFEPRWVGWTARASDTVEVTQSRVLHEGLMRCRGELAGEHLAAGRPGAAAAAFEATLNDYAKAPAGGGWRVRASLLWGLFLARTRTGDHVAARKALLELREILTPGIWALNARPFRGLAREGYPHARTHRALDKLLTEILAVALDRSDPGAPGAVRFLWDLVQNSPRLPPHMVFRKEERVGPLIAAFLRMWTELSAEKTEREVRFVQNAVRQTALTPAAAGLADSLAAVAREPELAPEVRALAVDLLCRAADLPVWHETREMEGVLGVYLPLPRTEMEDAALELWADVRALPRVERYRRELAFAFAERWRRLANGGRLVDWVLARTGLGAREEREAGLETREELIELRVRNRRNWTAERLRDWWAANEVRDPRSWLVAALGLSRLPEERDVSDLLERVVTTRWARRDGAHYLLTLVVGDTVAAPVRPGGERPPEELAHAWLRVLEAQVPPRPAYRLRIALIEFSADEPEGIVAEEIVREIRVGARIEIERDIVERRRPWRLAWGVHVPGLGSRLGVAPAPYRLHRVQLNGTGSLSLVRGRGVLSFTERRFGVIAFKAPSRPGKLTLAASHGLSSSVRRGFPAGFVLPFIPHVGIAWKDEGRPRYTAALVILEPPGSDPRRWTRTDWTDRLTANLAELATRLERDGTQAARLDPPLNDVWHTGTVLALPGARDSLATLDRKNDQGRRHPWSQKRRLLARILAGDVAALDEPDFAARIEKADGSPEYWRRVLRSGSDPRIRILAMGRLPDEPDAAHSRSPAEAPAMRAYLPWLIGAGLLDLLILWLAVASFRKTVRRRAATGLLLTGLIAASIHVELNGFDLVPDVLGFAAVAVGLGLRIIRPPARESV